MVGGSSNPTGGSRHNVIEPYGNLAVRTTDDVSLLDGEKADQLRTLLRSSNHQRVQALSSIGATSTLCVTWMTGSLAAESAMLVYRCLTPMFARRRRG
jgi:hypothetical protein